MYKVLVSDKLSTKGLDVFQNEPDIQLDVKLGLKPEELVDAIGEYEALVVRSDTKVTDFVIRHATKMRVIGRAGVGLDNIDIPSATRAGIIVMNTPDGNTISAAEHTLAMILSLARNIPQAHMSMKAGKWERSKFMGVELLGKTLGVIGLGRIGMEVAKRAQAFGMKIVAYDPFCTQERALKSNIILTDIPSILSTSDFITVHVPKTKDTTGLIGLAELSLLKPGVRLVNVARGGIYDEAALIEGVKSGVIAGVALDVFNEEPPTSQQLIELPQIILTPHLGASTIEAQENVAAVVALQIVEALRGGRVLNAVNMPAIDSETWKSLGAFHGLIQRMASFIRQLASNANPNMPISKIAFSYCGEVAGLQTKALSLAAMQQLLESFSDSVNFVNAPIIAKDRNIEITESTSQDSEQYTSLIRIEVQCGTVRHSVSGTLIANIEPRIVSIDGYRIDIEPTGNLILFFNRDVPGVIGQIGMILGEAKVNIAGFANGRKSRGGDAVTVINVDEEVAPDTLSKIAAIPGLMQVSVIRLG